jgi:outer membrane biosynthesis protein TonB
VVLITLFWAIMGSSTTVKCLKSGSTILDMPQDSLLVRLGTVGSGGFQPVQPPDHVSIGFGQFQPVMNSKNSKPVGYSGRTDRLCAGGLVGSSRVVRIFPNFLHLSRFHLLHRLPAISLKPTNPTLTPPSPSNPQINKPTNPKQSEKKRERKREWKRERKERKKEKKKPIQTNQTSRCDLRERRARVRL